ncbi:hypothetical protein HK096_000409, partial [Nowakowskiella sp. JEL0078]
MPLKSTRYHGRESTPLAKSPSKFYTSKFARSLSVGRRSIAEIMKERVSSPDFVDGDFEDAFFVADLGEVT